MMHEYKIDPWLHPSIRDLQYELQATAAAMTAAVQDAPFELPNPGNLIKALHRAGMCTYTNRERTQSAVQLPLLSVQACELILECAATAEYYPNEQEQVQYQMQEIVLSRPGFSLLHKQLKRVHNEVVAPLWVVLYGLLPDTLNSVQLAKYMPGEKARTNWHYDQDSNCTTTVSLNSTYQGGGMDLFPNLELPRSECGVATLFRGSSTLHRSRPVTEGERDLLVYWANHR